MMTELSNVRKIYFCETAPNAVGAYPGAWWIVSFDGNGRQVDDSNGVGVGNAEFGYHEKKEAELFLQRLVHLCPQAKVVHVTSKEKAISRYGLLSNN